MYPTDREPPVGDGDRSECASFEPRLEAYLDGELETPERDRIARHLAGCEACRRELEIARSLQLELRSLPALDAPQEVVAAALSVARSEADRPVPARGRARPGWWAPGWRPAAAVALAAALVAAAVLIAPRLGEESRGPSLARLDPGEVDVASIERASAEARLALAYVSTVSRRTGVRIRDDVIGRRWIGATAQELRSVTGIEPAAEPAEEDPRHHEI